MELADTYVSEAYAVRHAGSTPVPGTNRFCYFFPLEYTFFYLCIRCSVIPLMRKLFFFILVFCLFAPFAQGQFFKFLGKGSGTFGKQKPPYRYELILGLGATNFLGDLGGANQIGTHGVRDLEYLATRPAVALGIRNKISSFFSIKNNLCWGIVGGDDALTQEIFRNRRNINFRSPIIELSTQLEFNFIKEQKGHIYKISGVRGVKRKDRQIYLFAGGGVFYFNPKGKWDGKWYNLEPLHTEGASYTHINYMVSVGGGMRFSLNKYWGIGIDLGLRQTFTDYLDDVSTTYPDPAIFNGESVATHFSNPATSDNPFNCGTCVGEQRGQPNHRDSYMFATITAGYKVMYKKHSRSKF